VLVAWIDGGAVRVARGQTAAGTWDAAVSPAGGGIGGDTDVSIALNAAGDAILSWSWRRTASGPMIVQAAFRRAGGNWGAVAELGSAGTGRSHVQAAINNGGGAAVVWLDGTVLKGAGRSINTGNWSPSAAIATNVADAGARVAMNPAGNAIAVWGNKATGALRAAIRPAGGAWQPPLRISSPPGSSPRIALDSSSAAIAVWNRASSQLVFTESADLVPNGPVLASVTVPSRTRVGVTTNFAVTARAWAAPLSGAPLWRFGDGKSATGSHVTHVYRSTGTFTVTVSQGDAAGRRSVATRHTSVAP
jgi:hypothetical protein